MSITTQDSRILIKCLTTSGLIPTVAPSNDHTDGSWSETSVYIRELLLNSEDGKVWVRTNDGIKEFLVLPDTVSEGDLFAVSGSGFVRLSAGTSGYVLTSNGANTLPTYQASGGGGGSQTLEDTLDLGNTSGLNDIVFDDTYGLEFDNSSRLREGTIDAGLGGTNGIAQICGAGYELKWEGGRLYVMGSSGNTIRQSLYNLTTTPTVNDDTTKGYAVGSLWTLDDGTIYRCSDASTGSAVWSIESTITFKKVLTDTELLVTGDYDITELPAPPSGYAWKFLEASVSYDYGTIDYDTIYLSLGVDTAGKYQFDDLGLLAGTTGDGFYPMPLVTPTNSNPSIIESKKGIVNVAGSTQGDGVVTIYGTARLITL